MSLTLSQERNLLLAMAGHSARFFVTAETCYFSRKVRHGRTDHARDFKRAIQAKDWAVIASLSLADDVESLAQAGLAGAAAEIVADAGRRIAQARASHCHALGLDVRLAMQLATACEEEAARSGRR